MRPDRARGVWRGEGSGEAKPAVGLFHMSFVSEAKIKVLSIFNCSSF